MTVAHKLLPLSNIQVKHLLLWLKHNIQEKKKKPATWHPHFHAYALCCTARNKNASFYLLLSREGIFPWDSHITFHLREASCNRVALLSLK